MNMSLHLDNAQNNIISDLLFMKDDHATLQVVNPYYLGIKSCSQKDLCHWQNIVPTTSVMDFLVSIRKGMTVAIIRRAWDTSRHANKSMPWRGNIFYQNCLLVLVLPSRTYRKRVDANPHFPCLESTFASSSMTLFFFASINSIHILSIVA